MLEASRFAVTVGVAVLGSLACSKFEQERLKRTTKATYDQSTGRLKGLTYDVDKNGAHGALTTAAFDEDHDRRPDRQLTDAAGTLTLIESAPDASGRYNKQVHVT